MKTSTFALSSAILNCVPQPGGNQTIKTTLRNRSSQGRRVDLAGTVRWPLCESPRLSLDVIHVSVKIESTNGPLAFPGTSGSPAALICVSGEDCNRVHLQPHSFESRIEAQILFDGLTAVLATCHWRPLCDVGLCHGT
jgi:hypothetical protein